MAVLLFSAHPLIADITLTDKTSTLHAIATQATPLTPQQKQAIRDANEAKKQAKKTKTGKYLRAISDHATPLTPAQRQAIRDANRAKHEAKMAKRGKGLRAGSNSLHAGPNATGSIALVDAGGLKYFINTNITFSTSSSASGANSEASYTGPVAASTSAGGTTMSTLSDMFDGYNALCVSLTNATGPCATGDANYVIYNKNGPAAFDASVPATPACTNRQVVEPAQTIGGLSVQRKIFVPTNDRFIRWINLFTNTTGAPITFTTLNSNNLGSDANTLIVTSSSGDAVAQTNDLWVTTFQNYSGGTSSDPRIGHVMQGSGTLANPVSFINFANGDDNPWWGYSITLAPGQTKAIVTFATGMPSKAAAATQAAAIAAFGANEQQCMSAAELSETSNFASAADLSITKTSTPTPNVNAGSAYSYTLSVTNNGPAAASTVSVTDTLPAGVAFVSASGTGWACNQAAGTVTCTMPTLAVGAANPITINVTAPASATTVSNTATVSSATTDPTPGNNSSTNLVTVVAVANLSITKTASTTTTSPTFPFFYTINVSNAGPSTATSVQVTDTLPTSVNFVSASGTGWACNQVAGVVTCTLPSLAVGAANPITINVTAKNTTATTSNTATVSSATADTNPANNTSAAALVAIVAVIPTLDPSMLAMLAAILAAAAVFVIKRNG